MSSTLSDKTPIFSWGYICTIQGIPKFAIASVSIPKCGNNVIEIHTANRTLTVAGKSQHQQITIGVRHFVDANIAAALMAWRRQIITGDNLNAVGYKREISVDILGPGASAGGSIQGIGCWPSMIDFGEAAYDRSEIMVGSITLEVDDVDM